MTDERQEDPHAQDPVNAFYDSLKDVFDHYGRGVYPKLQTYGATCAEPVSLHQNTVRGWLGDRKALPRPEQFNAMMDFFGRTRDLLTEARSDELRSLYADAQRHRNGSRPKPSRPPQTDEPPIAGDGPVTVQVQANAHAHAHANGSSGRARAALWIGIGVGLGGAVASLVFVVDTRHEKGSPSTPSAAPQVVAAKTNAPPSGVPAGKPKGTAPTPPPERAPVALPGTPVPGTTSTRPESGATTPQEWRCTNVTADRAGVYTDPDTHSDVLKYKVRGDGIMVIRWSGTPAGWYMVVTSVPRQAHYWMQSKTLGPLRPSTTACPNH
ncbi:MAG: hypothetical protein ACRDHO_00395 [Actinomycetota bacterium]